MRYILLLIVAAALLVSCTPAQQACTEEAKLCPDGSSVMRSGPNCEFAQCPADTFDYNADPALSYIGKSPEICSTIRFVCTQDKEYFSDEHGCGCKTVLAPELPAEPDTSSPDVDVGNGKLQAIDCTDPRPVACTLDYTPVCGQKNDGTSMTYGNACGACGDKNVLSYVAGECAVVEEYANYTFQPRRCVDTLWDKWYAAGGIQFIAAPSDEELLIAYYGEKGVSLKSVTVKATSATCEACRLCWEPKIFTISASIANQNILRNDGWSYPQK